MSIGSVLIGLISDRRRRDGRGPSAIALSVDDITRLEAEIADASVYSKTDPVGLPDGAVMRFCGVPIYPSEIGHSAWCECADCDEARH